jgi:hypothetical protein
VESKKKQDYMQQRNALEYRKERASIGESVTSQVEISTKKTREYRTTVRIRPTKAQMWQAIELCKALGRDPTGKSYQWVVQLIFDSVLITKLKEGLIQVISEEVAEQKLREFKTGTAEGEKYMTIEGLDALKDAEEDTNLPNNITSDDFIRSEQDADMEDIGDLFNYEED